MPGSTILFVVIVILAFSTFLFVVSRYKGVHLIVSWSSMVMWARQRMVLHYQQNVFMVEQDLYGQLCRHMSFGLNTHIHKC